MKKYLSLLAILALLSGGCDNLTTGEASAVKEYAPWDMSDEPEDSWELGEDDVPEYDNQKAMQVANMKESIVFADTGEFIPGVGEEGVEAGTPITVITLPETGVWTVDLTAGKGDTDNDLFEVTYDTGISPNIVNPGISYSMGSGGGDVAASVVIKENVTLIPAAYSVRIKIDNAADGITFYKIFEFALSEIVEGAPPPDFKEAPKVYPKIKDGKNYLDIRWEKRASATSYAVYVGTTDVFDAAEKLGDYGEKITSAEFDNDGEGLPEDTPYWVWITATNKANATTQPSPAAKKRTTAPIPEFFWEPKDGILPLFDCLGADHYRFTQTTTGVGMGMTIKYWFGVEHYIGDVYYHEKFYPSGADNKPFPNQGKGKENCIGYPAGVFVIKYQEGHVSKWLQGNDNTPGKMKRYSAVYYWGMDTPETIRGYEHQSYIVNQWAGYAETVTLEEALDKFTCARIGSYLAMGPEPYAQLFHKDNLGTHGGEPEFPYE
jgi:hypothetical protein